MKSTSELILLVTGPRQIDVDFELVFRSDKPEKVTRASRKQLVENGLLLDDDLRSSISQSSSLNDFIAILETPRPSASRLELRF